MTRSAVLVLALAFVACAGKTTMSTGIGSAGKSGAGAAAVGGAAAGQTAMNMPPAGGGGVSAGASGHAAGATGGGGGVGGAAGSFTGAGTSGAGTSGAGGTGGTGGTGGAGAAVLVPAQGVLLGEYYGDGTVAATDARIGRKPTLHLVYYAWTDDWPSEAANDFKDGKIPLVNWEPDGIDFNDIVSGKLDSTIKARAAGSKALGKPFFLDFAAEMNSDEGWGGHDATLYINAYRHIHDVFVAGGATNVVFAWCPNVTDTDGANKTTLSYYPGDAYVDWTGVDGYNWGAGMGFAWQSFQDVFAKIYPLLAAKGKPILIGEMASDENGGDKGAWIDSIVPTLKRDFPMIKGVVWFDVKKERPWQINSSAGSLTAYMRMAADPYMNP